MRRSFIGASHVWSCPAATGSAGMGLPRSAFVPYIIIKPARLEPCPSLNKWPWHGPLFASKCRRTYWILLFKNPFKSREGSCTGQPCGVESSYIFLNYTAGYSSRVPRQVRFLCGGILRVKSDVACLISGLVLIRSEYCRLLGSNSGKWS